MAEVKESKPIDSTQLQLLTIKQIRKFIKSDNIMLLRDELKKIFSRNEAYQLISKLEEYYGKYTDTNTILTGKTRKKLKDDMDAYVTPYFDKTGILTQHIQLDAKKLMSFIKLKF